MSGLPDEALAKLGRGRGNRTPSRGFGDRWFTVNRYPYKKKSKIKIQISKVILF